MCTSRMLCLPSHSSKSMHFLRKLLKDCQNIQWFDPPMHPRPRGEDRNFNQEPISGHMTATDVTGSHPLKDLA